MSDAFTIMQPERQLLPIVCASPHSGDRYDAAFLAMLRPPLHVVRQAEDSFVDRIFAGVLKCGVPLLIAHFPRSYVDANRGPYELDADAFSDPLPPYADSTTRYVRLGLGSVATRAPDGGQLYRRKLRFTEVEQRLRAFYFPYHRALQELVADTHQRFGYCLLLDCHSMPSRRCQADFHEFEPADFVLGDAHGQSCRPEIRDQMGQALAQMGYRWAVNHPYAGGYTVRRYGHPINGIDALQIEILKSLYMDESELKPRPAMEHLSHEMQGLVERIGRRLLQPKASF